MGPQVSHRAAPPFQGTAPVMPVCSFHTKLIRVAWLNPRVTPELNTWLE